MRAKVLAPTMAAVLLALAGPSPAGAGPERAAAPQEPGRAGVPQRPARPEVRADFNGDGHEDLAIAAALEGVLLLPQAGSVNVLYGTAMGVAGTGSQLFNQATLGIGGAPEANDAFGWSLATGDYDDDGYTDLAIGVLNDKAGSVAHAGTVQVLYGTGLGLTTLGSQTFSQDSVGVGDTAEPADGFGQALATGDFDGDSVDDLAVGASLEDLAGQSGAGIAHVLYGQQNSGLTGVDSTTVSQAGSAVPSSSEAGDRFGSALTSGDFDYDGRDELAVASPGESLGPVPKAGTVTVLRGAAGGLVTSSGVALLSQDTPGVPGAAEANDLFGAALTSGDLTGDNRDDLAVGASGESVGTIAAAGAVTSFRGSPAGLTGTGSQQLTQDSGDLGSTAERNDGFGGSLEAGDFNGNGRDDLAIGVAAESVGAAPLAGVVNVVYGTPSGLAATGSRMFVQGTGGVATTPARSDSFGFSMTAADLTGDGHDELAVGAVGETVSGKAGAGMVHVLPGATTGLTGASSQAITQATPGVISELEANDQFGFAVSALRSPAG
jgi:hypothetical protein